jgi:dipeptidyl aminopeptidase/acylaminoacyl peptidase
VPRWSPDGSHIVFATGGKYGLAVIATIAADGTDMKLLTTPVWESLGANYMPDGKHIVFSSQQGGYVSALWIMDVNGKHQRRLTRPELGSRSSRRFTRWKAGCLLHASRHAAVLVAMLAIPKRLDISHWWLAEETAVFAIELSSVFRSRPQTPRWPPRVTMAGLPENMQPAS